VTSLLSALRQKKQQTSSEPHSKSKQLTFSVGVKLFIIIFCCVLIPVAATGLISNVISNRIITDFASQSAKQTIVQTSEKIDATISAYEQLVNQVITNLSLHTDLFNATNSLTSTFEQITAQNSIYERLSQLSYSDSNVVALSIIGTDPAAGAYSSSRTLTQIDREADWFKLINNPEQKFVWLHTVMEGYTGSAANRASFAVGRMFKSNMGQSYVVLVEIDQALLRRLIDGIQLSDHSEIYIVNGDNELLHASDLSQIRTGAALPLPTEGQSTETGQDGNEHIVVSHYSEKAGWYVVGSAPISELTAQTVVIREATLITILVGGLLAIAISIVVARQMGGPLRNLQRLMLEGAKGNLNVRTRFKERRDEIGQVGRSFNEMMEQIQGLVKQTSKSAADVLVTAQELTESAKETAQSAREISEATEQIASGASTLASEAERGNELVVDLSKQLQHVVSANRSMGEVASDVHKASERGTEYMSQLTDKTKATEEMTRRMVEKVDQLKESTSSIRNLLDMLTQITQQTNILALNASIEASRSGAAGRGFMVIAGEIRKLADESRKSIDVVADMIEHIQNGIGETVNVMSEAYPLFQEQITSVMDADKLFNDVRDRMIGLVQQADQVTEAIEQLEKAQHVLSDTMSSVSAVSEESSAISEEVASSSASQLETSDALVKLAGKLESLSGELTESLKKFRL
jgi:methyl-accepting chemotaxis protein